MPSPDGGCRGRPVVTFDLFSALLDSRTGGSAFFDRLASERGWVLAGSEVFDGWDAANKKAQAECVTWVPYRELAATALAATYSSLGIDGEAVADTHALLDSMADWPLWPDIVEVLPRLAADYRIGLLSNVDDDIFASTRVTGLVDHDVAMTSQRLRAYKPCARIYTEARSGLGRMVHVASSARDVRGALEAGCPLIRLRRPGHELDARGPRPTYEASDATDLPRLIARMAAE